MTHICVSKLTIIGSDNGLSPGRCQAIIWTNEGILFIGPLGTNFNETSIEIHTFSFKKIHLKMSSGKWRPFCLSLNVLSKMFLLWYTSHYSDVTWVSWHFKSPGTCLFHLTDCSCSHRIKCQRSALLDLFLGKSISERSSNSERFSILWRHHE